MSYFHKWKNLNNLSRYEVIAGCRFKRVGPFAKNKSKSGSQTVAIRQGSCYVYPVGVLNSEAIISLKSQLRLEQDQHLPLLDHFEANEKSFQTGRVSMKVDKLDDKVA
jgi:hypothetical protein